MEGLEPPYLTASDPKSDVSTNFTTSGLFSFSQRSHKSHISHMSQCLTYMTRMTLMTGIKTGGKAKSFQPEKPAVFK